MGFSFNVADAAGVEPATAWDLVLAPGTQKNLGNKKPEPFGSGFLFNVVDAAGVEPATAWALVLAPATPGRTINKFSSRYEKAHPNGWAFRLMLRLLQGSNCECLGSCISAWYSEKFRQ